ncbi:MAG: tetratricopeptide repeat protein, partial [Candidatus Nealsonbacteria bacterium]|nr:tetratricopeptide repeat protein [Candidatus Nealsonbacteria bacterium]
TVSRIMVGPVKENGEDSGEEETPQDQPKPTTITGKIVAADTEANTITLIRDANAAEPKEETLAVSPELEFASNYTGLARRCATRGIKLFPDDGQMYIILATVELRSGNRKAAIKVSEDGLKAAENSPQLMLGMADLQIDVGDFGVRDNAVKKNDPKYHVGARSTIRKMRAAPPEKRVAEPLIGYLTARIEFAESNWAKAAKQFESIRGGLARWPSHTIKTDLYLADCYTQLRNPDRQRSALRRVLNVDPLNAAALDALAKSYMQANRMDAALKIYEKMISLGRIPQRSQFTVLQMMVVRNMRLPPEEQNWKPVDEMLDGVLDATPEGALKPAGLVILKAESLRAQDREQEAIDLLAQERDKDPQQAVHWSVLATFAMRRNPPKWDVAEELLDNADKSVPGYSVILRLARSRYLIFRYGTGAAEQLAVLAKEAEQHFAAALAKNKSEIEPIETRLKLNGLSDDEKQELQQQKTELETGRARLENEQLSLIKGLLSANVQIGATPAAMQLSVRVSELDPNDVRLRFEHFDLALRSRASDDEMKKLSEEIRQVEGKGPYWLFTQAVMLFNKSDDKRLDDALEMVKQIRKLRPSWSRPLVIAARIYQRQGKPDLALKDYLTAINDMGNRNPLAIGYAVQLLYRQNRIDEAGELIDLLGGREQYLPSDIRGAIIDVRRRQDDIDSALVLARQEAANPKALPSAHVWLGRLLRRKWQKDGATLDPMQAKELLGDAEKSFRNALALEQTNADSWVALVYFLNVTNQAEKAELALKEAETQIPADRVSLALARCREQMKQPDKARPLYEAAFAKAPSDPIVARLVVNFLLQNPPSSTDALSADKVLKLMIDGKIKGTKENVQWARREMATLLQTRGGYQNLKSALKLVGRNLAASPTSVSDLRLKSKLLARHPQRASRQQAIEILEKLSQRERSPLDDQFVLAKLYLSEDAWGKASKQFRSLFAALDTKDARRRDFSAQCMASYIKALIAHDEFGTARSYLTDLKAIAPHSYGVVDMEALLLVQRGEYDKAFDRLIEFLRESDAFLTGAVQRAELMAQFTRQVAMRMELTAAHAEEVGEQAQTQRFDMEAAAMYGQYVRSAPLNRIHVAAFLARRGKIDAAINEINSCQGDTDPSQLAHAANLLIKHPKATAEQVQRLEGLVQAAMERSPECTDLLLLMAELRSSQEKYVESEAHYRDVLKIAPGHPSAMNNLAVLLALQKKKLPEALKLINSAIEDMGPIASMLDSRATVYMALGQPDKALADLKLAIIEKDTPVRLFHQAKAYMEDGEQTRAATASLKLALKNGLTPEMLEPIERRLYNEMTKELKL